VLNEFNVPLMKRIITVIILFLINNNLQVFLDSKRLNSK
jgi:hypothetical protein